MTWKGIQLAKRFVAKIMFSEFILADDVLLPLGCQLSLYDLEFLQSFLALNKTRIMKMGQLRMDSRLQRALQEQSEDFQWLRCLHLGAVSKSFWLSQFLNKHMKSEQLEEVGWSIVAPSSRMDLQTVFENCPQLHKLYINMQRCDVRNVPLNEIIQVSVKFSERLDYLFIK